MKKILNRIMIYALLFMASLALVVYLFMQQSKFGRLPSGERLERIKKSPNYKDGSFKNLSHTPDLTEGVSYYAVMKDFFFSEKKRIKPSETIPHTKTDLLNLNPEENVLIWFGHSSYFMQIDRKKILVDPVMSGTASPLSFTTPSFAGTDPYSTDDLPKIDYLFISHDHWDHVDYHTLLKLKPKVKKVIGGLGIGAHLEHWGYDKSIIIEEDWNTTLSLDSGFTVHTSPARHFSGRGFSRNKTLWLSFVLVTPTIKIYIGGDSGYDSHFAEIGTTWGPFDLAILENGQYDKSWKYIHMMPDEVLQAARDLRASRLFPVHSSKFALANHPWDDPLQRITELNKLIGLPLVTPIIGEKVNLNDTAQVFSSWWEGMN
jgi:L-ascorbate metabolism protein UlaG (beta-lactamase superfamily)